MTFSPRVPGKEWNTNAKRAAVAQRVFDAIVRAFGADVVLKDKRDRDAFAAYTKRHLQRLDKLRQATYLVDATLGAIERTVLSVDPEDAPQTRKRKTTDDPDPDSRVLDDALDASDLLAIHADDTSDDDDDDDRNDPDGQLRPQNPKQQKQVLPKKTPKKKATPKKASSKKKPKRA